MENAIINIPSACSVRIEGREQFPGLDVEQFPSPFTSDEHVNTFVAKLRKLTYTNLVETTDCAVSSSSLHEEKKKKVVGTSFAWFADQGDWVYSITKNQRNAFTPMTWPSWLRDLGYQLGSSLKLNQSWRACLVTRLVPGSSHTRNHMDADQWQEKHELFCDVILFKRVVDKDNASRISITIKPRPNLKNASRAVQFDMESGGILVSRGRSAREDWDTVFQFDQGQDGDECFCISFRPIHPLLALAQSSAKYPHQTPAAMDCEYRFIPSMLKIEKPIVKEEENKKKKKKRIKAE